MRSNPLPKSYYINSDTILLSKNLLGKILISNINNDFTSGIIVEIEAYLGVDDRASHAYNNKFTLKTKPMYEEGGISYIYLCYGIHHLFNIVTNIKGIPHAILIRAIEPIKGISIMLKRRKFNILKKELTNGPGKLTQALGITTKMNTISLDSNKIWIEDHNVLINKKDILSSSRIGVDYAGEDAKLPYRFYIKNNKWISK